MYLIMADSLIEKALTRTPSFDSRHSSQLHIWDWFALILPALAISPLLYLQAIFLWEKQHLQFYPLAFAAAGWFFYQEGANNEFPGSRRKRIAFAVSLVFMLVAAYSLLLSSPWMAQFSLVLLIFSWALGRFGNMTALRVTGICGLLAVTVPAPMDWDHKLVQSLQSLSSTISSRLMDATEILHVKRGNIIEISTGPLFVEEACSGVDSQYALMAVAGVLLLIGRAGLIVSLITIVTVPIWAILGNLLRIYSIVIGLEFIGLDLATGTPHTILGLLVFALAAWAHWSSVQFLNFIELTLSSHHAKSSDEPLAVAGPSPRSMESQDRTHGLIQKPYWLVLPALTMLLMPAGLYAVMQHYNKQVPTLSKDFANRFPSAMDMPSIVSDQSQVHFSGVWRDRRNLLGQCSRTWNYSGALGNQVASFDFPFRGWHPLWECYLNAGWRRLESVEVSQSPDGQPLTFPFFETALENDEGDFAIMHFSLFDEHGEPYQYSGGYEQPVRGNRLSGSLFSFLTPRESTREPLTFQFQLLSKTYSPATPEQIIEFRRMYLSLRDQVYVKSMPIVKELSRR
jgi:exosortase